MNNLFPVNNDKKIKCGSLTSIGWCDKEVTHYYYINDGAGGKRKKGICDQHAKLIMESGDKNVR